MKNFTKVLVLFIVLFSQTAFAQSVRINFIRYKQIDYLTYIEEWEDWPSEWSESGAYAIVKKLYGETYSVTIYGNDDSYIISSKCTFDSSVTGKKRVSSELPYLNCYSDAEGDQVWTNVVSLGSLVNDVTGWKQDDAQLYLWILSADEPFAFVFE
jgi:hypothetical protein